MQPALGAFEGFGARGSAESWKRITEHKPRHVALKINVRSRLRADITHHRYTTDMKLTGPPRGPEKQAASTFLTEAALRLRRGLEKAHPVFALDPRK